MILLRLALKSLRNRIFTSLLTVVSIALSVSLLLCVQQAKRAAQEGFTQTISHTDLIVGARSGPLQLLLYSVFNMGSATNNVSFESYQKIAHWPAVDWTIPYSLGDSHKGYRVVGTNEDFFTHYHYRGLQSVSFNVGQGFSGLWDVVLGSQVAATLNYKLGDHIVLTHGVTKGEGILQHSDKPFTVVGILNSTGTPLDRAVYVSLEGLEGIHMDWQNGAAPTAETAIPADKIKKENIKIGSITSFFLGAKSRLDVLKLQRQINNFSDEPLLAIIPGVTLSELWNGLSYIEGVLKAISWMVIVVGFMAMLIALMTSLNERRREMAILCAVGAKSSQIVSLLVFESSLLTFMGIILGVCFSGLLGFILRPWLENEFGLSLEGPMLTSVEFFYLLITFVGGVLIGLIPALRAQNLALKDGLSVRV
jgi:putative ABC transport system permease protein